MFSNATIATTLDLIKEKSVNNLDNFFIRFGIPRDLYNGFHKMEKINNVITYLDENRDLSGILSSSLNFDIVEEIINDFLSSDDLDSSSPLYRLIKRGGFDIYKNQLIKIVPSEVNISKDENLIKLLLEKHNFETSKGHLEQALRAYTRGEWASANAQLRSYVEDLTGKMAERITGKTFNRSHDARKELATTNPEIFISALNEWDDKGNGYFNVFWKRLHPQGSHPGLSDEKDCIFRINIVLINTSEILRRYDEQYS